MEAMNVQLMPHVQIKWVTTHVIAKMVSVVMATFVLVGEGMITLFSPRYIHTCKQIRTNLTFNK